MQRNLPKFRGEVPDEAKVTHNNGLNCQPDMASRLLFEGWVAGIAWDGVEMLEVELRTSKFN